MTRQWCFAWIVGGPVRRKLGGASEKQPRTKSSSGKVQSRSVPLHLPKEDPGEALPVAVTPAIEKEHVHAVYDTIAVHWDHTRHAPWPQVASFLQSLPHGSPIADVGCGNGKYMQPAYIGRPVAAGGFSWARTEARRCCRSAPRESLRSHRAII